MSIANKVLPLSMVTSMLLFTACGGGSTSTDDNAKSVSVPTKISIDIPDSLKLERNSNAVNKSSSLAINDNAVPVIKSYGYEQLQNTISQAETTIQSVKSNMEYLNLMMPDISKACLEIDKSTTCTIPSGTVKLTVQGKTLPMGEILYTAYESTKKHQYVVVLDLKPALKALGAVVNKDLETVKWSLDEKHIETISDVQFENENYTMKLGFDKANDGSSKMTITDSFSSSEIKGNFTLKLDEKNDSNHTVDVQTTGTTQYNEESNSFSSQGTVSDQGGYLVSKGSVIGEKFAEKETFDNTGKLLQSSFCHNDQDCQLSDSTSWIKYDESEGIVEEFDNDFDNDFDDDIDIDFQEPIELTFSKTEKFPTFTYCEILPSNYSGLLKENDIYSNSIGSIARFEDEMFGIFLSISEKENINTLPIACISSKSSDFFMIEESMRPTIGFKE